MFSLEFATDNDAFKPDDRPEASKILRRIAGYLEEGNDMGPIFDDNGNRIGSWKLED